MSRILGFAILLGLMIAAWMILSRYLKHKRRMRGHLRVRLPGEDEEGR